MGLCVIVCVFSDPTSMRGQSMLVLCEQELLAFDLEAPK